MRLLPWLMVLLLAAWPVAAWAEGEDDPLWQQNTYEKKLFTVGQRILQANGIGENIIFQVKNTREVNAYAQRAGNVVTITPGLLRYMSNDDELAAILGHEIAHIIERHQGRARTRRGLYAVGALLLLGEAAPLVLNKPVKNHMQQGYETEADLVGIDLMVRAGYNPLAVEKIMSAISGDANWFHRFSSTHPQGIKRLKDIRNHIASRYPQFLTAQLQQNWTAPMPTMTGQSYVPASLQAKGPQALSQAVNVNPPSPTQSPPNPDLLALKQLAETGESKPLLETTAATASPTAETTMKAAPTEMPANQLALAPANPAAPVATEKPSLSAMLLSLGADHLTLLKTLSKRGYLNEEQMAEEVFQARSEEHREALIMELQQKKLIRIVGARPQRVFVLAEWVADELKQATP